MKTKVTVSWCLTLEMDVDPVRLAAGDEAKVVEGPCVLTDLIAAELSGGVPACAVITGSAFAAAATFLVIRSAVCSRAASMSINAMWQFASSGKSRMSPIRFFAKTTLPAPIRATAGASGGHSKPRRGPDHQELPNQPRATLPRINSATSGFFFWGMMLLPVV